MAINCGQNPLLAKVQASKDALKSKMAAIKVPGLDNATIATKLQELKDAKASLKADLEAAVELIPELPDYQKTLDKLKGDITSRVPGWKDKLTEFESQWGGAVQDIEQLVSTFGEIAQNPLKALDFDICDQPDIEGEPDPNNPGKLLKKDKPPKAQDSTKSEVEEPKGPVARLVTESFIPSGSILSGTDVELYRAILAEREVEGAIKDAMKEFNADLKKVQKERKKIKKKAEKEQKNGVPKSFGEKYPGALYIEHKLLNNVSVSDMLNEYFYLYNKEKVLFQMKRKIDQTIRLIDGFYSYGNSAFLKAWENGGWNLEIGSAIGTHFYLRHGFGLLEDDASYGRYLESLMKITEVKAMMQPAFNLKPGDYTASKTPTYYNYNDILNNATDPQEALVSPQAAPGRAQVLTYVGNNKVTKYKNILQDIVGAMMSAKEGGDFALGVQGAQRQERLLSDFLANCATKASQLLVKGLGGDLVNMEDEAMALPDRYTMSREEEATYSTDNFKPHFMYKGQATVYATSHEDHVQLSRLGYVHSQS